MISRPGVTPPSPFRQSSAHPPAAPSSSTADDASSSLTVDDAGRRYTPITNPRLDGDAESEAIHRQRLTMMMILRNTRCTNHIDVSRSKFR